MRYGVCLEIGMAVMVLTSVSSMAGPVKAPTVSQLKQNPELLARLYEPARSGIEEEYYFRGYLKPGESQPAVVPFEYGQEDLYVVRSGSEILYIKKKASRDDRPGRKAIRMDVGAPVLCLPNWDNGNGAEANPWFVVLLKPLRLLGQVSDVGDSADGVGALFVVAGGFEACCGLCHADSPSVDALFRVENGALVMDREKTQKRAEAGIAAADAEFRESRPRVAAALKQGNEIEREILPLVLAKFLNYRMVGRTDDGWKELRKDLRAFGGERFPVGCYAPGKSLTMPVKEIEREVAKSVKRMGALDEALKNYVSEPLR